MGTAGLNFLLGLWCLPDSAALTVDCPVATKQPDPRSRKSKRRSAKRRVTWGPPRALRQWRALVLRTKAQDAANHAQRSITGVSQTALANFTSSERRETVPCRSSCARKPPMLVPADTFRSWDARQLTHRSS